MATRRVVTWNIRAAIGPGPFPDRWWARIDAERLRAIGDLLGSTDAEIIALQEVALLSRDGALIDNAGDLARQLGMEVSFSAVRTFSVMDGDAVTGVGCFGNALLSRTPIFAARTVALPAAPMDALIEPHGVDHRAAGISYADAPASVREPRCLLIAQVDGLTIGSTHFSHNGSGERLLQAVATVAAFDSSSRALLLGDLNAAIESPELAPFGNWTDALDAPPGDAARVSTDDGMRIDQVLARGVSVSGGKVLRQSGDLSDHYPLGAEVVAPS
ncbi:MAG: endonuclease/exonuclease/phosphatase family protein [Chloroflexota bacterium]|nr:endonuclease/exonuclease/phosphatase family protein [Chloroflexota bacterium]